MTRYPQTLEEASRYRYRKWAGNSNGTPFNPLHCAAQVWEKGRGALCYQCTNKPGKGPSGLYCGIHARSALSDAKNVAAETRFRLNYSETGIVAVDVIGSTGKTITLKGGRTVKMEGYFRTADEALNHMIQIWQRRSEHAKASLAQADLNIKSLMKQKESGKPEIKKEEWS